MRYGFAYTEVFMKGAAAIFSESDLMEIELYLCANPSAGVVIPQGGRIRKLRWAAKGHGKAGRLACRLPASQRGGGGRPRRLLCENEKENLTNKELKGLRESAE